ncbi:DHA2 family efflux MFS transporter permease subunit [Actinoallomurus sp. NBC_01490]|uniref:DHA2 family efflux MFS transporter permease subunit n=1 Tax=Actinoallomurus sp. NBC_01490 TaxID=2903557 RepID=UPI002E340A14|nr:DHA2 family efflux MFS transporter permease subunit [Actinoallomurus sp. NBC_01490]
MSRPSRTAALVALCAAMLMIVLDGSIVTVALPAIQSDLRFSASNLTWTVNSYMIAFGGLLLLAGRLGDLVGRKRMFVAGLAVFTVASLLCGVSTGQDMLIAARFVQGVGGAMTSAVSLGMIVTHFPEPRERGRAIGAYAFVGAAGASIGQVLGGVLTEAVSWHWIFFINLPIGAAAALLAVRVLEPDQGLGLRAGADLPGALLVTAGLMLGVYTIVETSRYGWGSAHTLGYGALALMLLAGFVVRQATAAAPLLPLEIFRSRTVAGANAVQVLMVSALFGFQILIALYLQQVRGYGAAGTGLAMLPAALAIATVSLVLSARLNARFGEHRVLLAGIALLVVGIGLLTRLPVHAGYAVDLLPTMLLAGGFGLATSALTTLGMSGAGAGDAGLVSGLFNTSQQVGGALGVAVLSTFAAARTRGLTGAGHDRATALTGGFHVAFGIGAGLLVAALVLTAAVLRRPPVPVAEEQARPEEAPAPSPAA